MRRYVLTGTPGAGKTAILRGLAARGHTVVEEAATEVITRAQAAGEAEPWTRASFIDEVITLQRRQQLATTDAAIQIYDRSPICTHALATYLGHPVSPALAAELDRITSQAIYQPQVLFIRNLGFCEPTPARRITFEESLTFERLHEQTYRTFGYDLVDIPAADLSRRIDLVETVISGAGW
ncbi:ATP-binding protein [Uniformispora flossi]|uniref:ATP/GTP-binding protein n=1 Tax=Uniformispora flossi TaxID=3390723 RepID=UPI003C2CF61A